MQGMAAESESFLFKKDPKQKKRVARTFYWGVFISLSHFLQIVECRKHRSIVLFKMRIEAIMQ